jgi:hypothetical protein
MRASNEKQKKKGRGQETPLKEKRQKSKIRGTSQQKK